MSGQPSDWRRALPEIPDRLTQWIVARRLEQTHRRSGRIELVVRAAEGVEIAAAAKRVGAPTIRAI